jgi:delta-aminolevulinic acid dehydratase/porphobilinogen synthase
MSREREQKKRVKIQEFILQRIWNMKNMIMPVIIGATGIVTKGLKKNLEAMPGKHSIDSLQKTALLGTSHTVRKALQSET